MSRSIKSWKRVGIGWLLAAGALGASAAGCGPRGSSSQSAAQYPQKPPAPAEYAGAKAGARADLAPGPAAEPHAAEAEAAPTPAPRSEAEAPSASERPGLGTEWGETRYSHISEVPFQRARQDSPDQLVSIHYNDRSGVRAMTHYRDYRRLGSAVSDRGWITVSLRDEHGDALAAVRANGEVHAIGEAGQRYTIVLHNNTGRRFEAVTSVDGLDVLDGKAASYEKRGYLVPAWGDIEIDGFRQSVDEVAAFRFGAVSDSYAAQTGSDRNVGVIGVAVFAEREESPSWPWTRNEIERRRTADPFPGRFASPP